MKFGILKRLIKDAIKNWVPRRNGQNRCDFGRFNERFYLLPTLDVARDDKQSMRLKLSSNELRERG